MKRFIFICTLLLSVLTAAGKNYVQYYSKPLSLSGCTVRFYTLKEQGKYFISVMVHSEIYSYTSMPELKLKTFKGEVITLNGTSLGSKSNNGGVIVGKQVISSSSTDILAQFPIDESEIDKLNDGISKIRISLIPVPHEKEFKKDKIGKKLYKMFRKLAERDDSF